jgi:drug/metabolite transporter (DMT)-like permease
MNAESATQRLNGATVFAAGLAIVLWSSSFAGIAYGLKAFTPAELSLLRFLIASTVLAVPVASGLIKLPPLRDWPAILALGFIGITLYQLMLGYAMTRISVGAAAVVIALSPGVTSALAALRLGERISRSAMVGLVVAFAGVVLITVGAGREFRFEPMTLLTLIAVLATSIYFVWQKPLLARTTTVSFTVASIFAGTIGLIPFGLDLPAKVVSVPHAQLWSAAYLGIVPTIVGYFCWNFALSRAPASKVSSFLYVQPLVASVIAWFCLGQVPTWATVAGGMLAIGGVVLTVRSARTATAAVVTAPVALVPAPARVPKVAVAVAPTVLPSRCCTQS